MPKRLRTAVLPSGLLAVGFCCERLGGHPLFLAAEDGHSQVSDKQRYFQQKLIDFEIGNTWVQVLILLLTRFINLGNICISVPMSSAVWKGVNSPLSLVFVVR